MSRTTSGQLTPPVSFQQRLYSQLSVYKEPRNMNCSSFCVSVMEERREGLRHLLWPPKKTKQPAKPNAQRCADHRVRLMIFDPKKFEERKEDSKKRSKAWRANLTPEQREIQKVKGRRNRQQKRRQSLKEIGMASPGTPVSKKTSKTATPTRASVKMMDEKAKIKREKARNRQANRRERIKANPQKYRREKEKRSLRYFRDKARKCIEQEQAQSAIVKKRTRWRALFNHAKRLIQRSRSKLGLFKLAFLKKLMAKDAIEVNEISTYIRKPKKCSVERFLRSVAVDIPFSKCGEQPKKVLTKRMFDTFRDFKKSYPDTKISFSTFKRRRPHNILLAGSTKFFQCLCETCINTMLLLEPVNSFLKKVNCDHPGLDSKISNVDELVAKTLCSEYSRSCIDRDCPNCGCDDLISSMRNQIGESGLLEVRKWKRWEKTPTSPKDLVTKENTVMDILELLRCDLMLLARHLKTAQWQRSQYQSLCNNLPVGHCVLTVDFAENYVCKFRHEVQSAHWSYRQLSIHPCVFIYRCDKPNCRKTVTDYQVFISDDLRHDSAMTKVIFDKCLQYAESKGILSIQIFSDGCGSQYKSRLPFFNLTELQASHPSLKIGRHFFGSSHGKSLCDSCGGTIKRCAHNAVACGRVESIQNALEMYSFCNSELLVDQSDCIKHMIRSFVLINPNEMDRSLVTSNFAPIKGTRSIHALVPLGVDKLKVRSLSCFCPVCLVGEEGTCENEDFTLQWREVSGLKKRLQSKLKHRTTTQRKQRKSRQGQSPSPSSATSVTSFNAQASLPEAVMISREDFFVRVYHHLSLSNTIDELLQVAHDFESGFDQFPLPVDLPKSLIEVGGAVVDRDVMQLVPNDLSLNVMFPVAVESDGNCVPRSLSVSVFGDQDHHLEIRCRIVIELARRASFYVTSLDDAEVKILCETADEHFESVEETYFYELLSVKSVGTFMGLWQLMVAANIFGAKILSVYPKKGVECHRKLLNRTLRPKNLLCAQTICLFWSSTRDDLPDMYWTANHVSPLLPISPDIEVEVVED